MKMKCALFGLALLIFCIGAAQAQNKVDLSASQRPTVQTVPPEAHPSDQSTAEAATNAYLAQIPPAARARSDAYFEGGYWLLLWDFLMSAIIYWLLLHYGWSAKMRDLAERLTRFKPLETFIFWLQFMIITSLFAFSLSSYQCYFREVQYGLATQ